MESPGYQGKCSKALVIAHSINPQNQEIVTFQLEYPRFIHAEYMTHRAFSRNASSSRAIPVTKMLKQITERPGMPIHWGANQPGMQAGGEVSPEVKAQATKVWLEAAASAAKYSELLMELGLHKQVANRLTEPFQVMKVVMTATTVKNFFELRDHEAAQPEIRDLAKTMILALTESKPVFKQWGEWHLPYITPNDTSVINQSLSLVKVSTARCARVSYDRHDGEPASYDADYGLYDRLVLATPPHMSPAEHPAESTPGKHANFQGWASHRWQMGA